MVELVSVDNNTHYINHHFLQENQIENRKYQINIFQGTKTKNSLVVLPTALGKTMIAILTAADVLERAPNSKIFILAPTRPLILQHYTTFRKLFKPEIKCCLFSSNLSPLQRTLNLNDYQIFFSTPQIIQNDIKEQRYGLNGVGIIVFDEAHKARRNYAYTYVASKYIEQCSNPLILGLTASPGKNIDYINLLCEKLAIEQIIFRELDSPDVQEYIFPIDTIFTRIVLPEPIIQAQAILDTAIRKDRDFLIQYNIFGPKPYTSKMDFIRLMQDLRILDELSDSHYCSDPEKQTALRNQLSFPQLAEIYTQAGSTPSIDRATVMIKAILGIYLTHLQEILTTQDVRMFWSYLNRLDEKAQLGNKQIQHLLHSETILAIKRIVKPIIQSPKIPELISVIQEEMKSKPNGKYIIFAQYREMASYIVDTLNQFSFPKGYLVQARRFVGQAYRPDDPGLSQKEQAKMIQEFTSGIFNILVATSVAEEGLDIPNVDAVIFYEAIPSEIRLIQRRGRTGRHSIGKCYFLVTPHTLDQTYHYVSHRKEEKMHEMLKHPDLISTVPELPRSSKQPYYQSRSESVIQAQFIAARADKEKRKTEALADQIELHKHEQIRRTASKIDQKCNPMTLVTDITQNTVEWAKSRVEKTQANKIILQHSKEKTYGFTKKLLNWILCTMEVLRDPKSTRIICKLDDLLAVAREEHQDLWKIEKEIEKGIESMVFTKIKEKGIDMIIYNDDFFI